MEIFSKNNFLSLCVSTRFFRVDISSSSSSSPCFRVGNRKGELTHMQARQ